MFFLNTPHWIRTASVTAPTSTEKQYHPLCHSQSHPQGCVLSPFLFSLFTHDCAATHSSNFIVKFADDTTIVGLITDNDESAYREDVDTLTKWCQDNNLSLNISKTKEMIVDYRRWQEVEHAPLHINGSEVEKFSCF